MHPLDARHFYERTDRYAWQDSRFSKHCKAHDNERRRASYAANAQQQNLRTAERRRVDRSNRKTAAVFYTPVQTALRDQRKQDQQARRERVALWKRVYLRTYGPRDGVKALIKERQAMYDQRRRRQAAPPATQVTSDLPRRTPGDHEPTEVPSTRQTPEEAQEALRLLRARHEQEQQRAQVQTPTDQDRK